jgi:glycosyltransferase involved in cell wall biosynthesis
LCIKDAINSIIKQEYKNWELIINDASIDNTLSIIKEFKNKKIIVNSISRNIGA